MRGQDRWSVDGTDQKRGRESTGTGVDDVLRDAESLNAGCRSGLSFSLDYSILLISRVWLSLAKFMSLLFLAFLSYLFDCF